MPEHNVRDELSLQEIENKDWGNPENGETDLVSNVRRWRRTPVRELGTEGLRELILQQVSMEIPVPLALPVLEIDPRAAGDMYPGDLLDSVLQADAQFWAGHPELAERVEGIIAVLDDDPDEVDLSRDIAVFRAASGRLASS
jgi:CDI immunity proteins